MTKLLRSWQFWLAALVLAVLIWFFLITPWRDVVTATAYHEAAKRNPYLALQTFIQESGREAQTVTGLDIVDDLPSTDDMLVITGKRFTLSEQQSLGLLEWVKQGGHLVVLAGIEYDEDAERNKDHLLDALEYQMYSMPIDEDEVSFVDTEGENKTQDASTPEDGDNSSHASDEDKPKTIGEQMEAMAKKSHASRCNTISSPTTLGVENEDDISFVIPGSRLLVDYSERETVMAENDLGTTFIYSEYEQGKVTVLTSMALWRNSQLMCADNAYLFAILAIDHPKVWIAYLEDMDGLLSLTWQHFPQIIVASVLLVLLWLWSQRQNLGRKIRVNQNQRRFFKEHLVASAEFVWQLDKGNALINQLRQECLHAVKYLAPDFDTWSQQEQLSFLKQHSGIDMAQIEFALFAEIPSQDAELIGVTRLLQQLRKRL